MHQTACKSELDKSTFSSGILFFKRTSSFLIPGHPILKIQVATNSYGPTLWCMALRNSPQHPLPTQGQGHKTNPPLQCYLWELCLSPHLSSSLRLSGSSLSLHSHCFGALFAALHLCSPAHLAQCGNVRMGKMERGVRENEEKAHCNSLLPTFTPQSMSFDKCIYPCPTSTQIRIQDTSITPRSSPARRHESDLC